MFRSLPIIPVVLALVSLPQVASAQRGGPPSPDRIFDWLDSNKDGQLDQEELGRAPEGVRRALESAGVSGGTSKEKFVGNYDRIREGFQAERDRGGDRGSDRGGDRGDRGRGDRDDRDRDDRNSTRTAPTPAKPIYTPAERAKVTLALPDTFTERDLDGDGQIAFYEWRAWDRSLFAEFLMLDVNGDGFLTPRELTASTDAPKPSGTTTGRSTTVTSGSGTAARSTSEDPEAAKAVDYFKVLDANKDGRVNPREWDASRRLKPMFEAKGIRLDNDMTQEQFVAGYLKASGR